MPLPQDNNENKSFEIQEIFDSIPSWMSRWGTTIIFALIIMFGIISWVIKYPDIIQGKAIITASNPPVLLVNKVNGELANIHFSEGEFINKGAIISEIENPVSTDEIDSLTYFIEQVETHIKNYQEGDTIPYPNMNKLTFGEIQLEYNSLIQNIVEYNITIIESRYKQNIENLKTQISLYQELSEMISKQIRISDDEVTNKKYLHEVNQSLYEKGVISKLEYLNKKDSYGNTLKNNADIKKSLISNEISIANIKNRLLTLQTEFSSLQRLLIEHITQSIQNIKNMVINWSQRFVITASVSGHLTFLKDLHPNQYVNSGDQLFAIIPKQQELKAILSFPTQGSGKVRIGQEVRIQLDNYPSTEFGEITGLIQDITLLPIEKDKMNWYKAFIEIDDSLITTYGKHINYAPNMEGIGNIVTEDLRIIERVFNRLRNIVSEPNK
jgi:multidrug efflux pump subunit AcrA (membrane-fusion protein)